jgi:PTH1 family peptidyl-tRNA hydrolase
MGKCVLIIEKLEYNNQVTTDQPIKLIVGLGNPDPDLKNTYHNAGALAVEFLATSAAAEGQEVTWKRHKNIFEYVKRGEKIFVKPLVYMNESGRAVKEALRAFDVPSRELMVIYDESDLLVGEVKFVVGGGTAGHKGLISIIDHVKADDFLRARIGIRDKNEVRRKKAGDFVLSPVSKNDRAVLEKEVFPQILSKLS